MKNVYDLAELDWQVAGFSPYMWENRSRRKTLTNTYRASAAGV